MFLKVKVHRGVSKMVQYLVIWAYSIISVKWNRWWHIGVVFNDNIKRISGSRITLTITSILMFSLTPCFLLSYLPCRVILADAFEENVLVVEWQARFNRDSEIGFVRFAKYLIFLCSTLAGAFLFMFSRCNRAALSMKLQGDGTAFE